MPGREPALLLIRINQKWGKAAGGDKNQVPVGGSTGFGLREK